MDKSVHSREYGPEVDSLGAEMAKKKPKHYTGANPERVRADLARRSSGAAGAHVSGKRGTRTRKGAKQTAIRENRDSW